MGKLFLFLADGCEECEALITVDILRRAKLDVVTVSINGTDEIVSSHGISVKADAKIEDIDFENADMLILPGGMPGTTNLEKCEKLMEQVDAFNEAKRPIAAICAAPGIFGRRGILKGKKATSYPSVTDQLKGATVLTDKVVTDGHITTSRGLGTAIDFGLAIAERFCGRDVAEDIAKGIVYI